MLKKLLLLLAFLVPAAFASNSLAVLDIMVSVHDDVELTVHETHYLTDELRRYAVLTLPQSTAVFSRDSVISNLSKSSENIVTAIDAGRALNAKYVVTGVVGLFQGMYSLRVELYEVSSGKMLGTFVTESEDAKGLLGTIRGEAPRLFALIPKEEIEVKETKEPEPQKQQVIVTEVDKTEPKETAPNKIEAMPAAKTKKSKAPFYVALGLDIVGAVAVGFGVYKQIEAKRIHDSYNKMPNHLPEVEYDSKLKEANDARKVGNISLIAGGALLAGGIAVHIWF